MGIQSITENIVYYQGCSELPVRNFFKCVETGDRRWLIVGYRGYEEVEEPNIELWKAIYNEYCELVDSSESRGLLVQEGQLNALEMKLMVCSALLAQLLKGLNEEAEEAYMAELASWGFAFNKSKLASEIKRAEVWLKSIKTKIGFIRSDLESSRKKKVKKYSMERQQVKLEHALGKNNIDLETTSIAKWVELVNQAKEMAKQRKKQIRRGK